jgi:hypothetical protein
MQYKFFFIIKSRAAEAGVTFFAFFAIVSLMFPTSEATEHIPEYYDTRGDGAGEQSLSCQPPN